jgi:hypothetical protein
MEQLYSKNKEYPKVLPDVVMVKSNNVALHGKYMVINKEDVTMNQLKEVGYVIVEPEPDRTKYTSNIFWNGTEWEFEFYTEDQWKAILIDRET